MAYIEFEKIILCPGFLTSIFVLSFARRDANVLLN